MGIIRRRMLSVPQCILVLGTLAVMMVIACSSEQEDEPAAPAAPAPTSAPQAVAPAAPAPTAAPASAQAPPQAMGMEPKGELFVGVPLLHPLVQLQEKDANGTVGGPGTDFQIFEGIFRAQFTEPGTIPSQEIHEPEISESWTIADDIDGDRVLEITEPES